MNELSPEGQRMVEALREERMNKAKQRELRDKVLGAAFASSLVAGTLSAKASGGTAAATKGAAAASGSALGASSSLLGTKLASAGLAWKLGVTLACAVPVSLHVAHLLQTRQPSPVAMVTREQVAPAKARENSAILRVHHPSAVSIRSVIAESTAVRPLPVETLVVAELEPGNAPPLPLKTVVVAALQSTNAPRAQRAFAPGGATLGSPRNRQDESDAARLRSRDLRREREVIERALCALRDGNTLEARAALAEHEEHFSNGVLAPEREHALARLNAEVAR